MHAFLYRGGGSYASLPLLTSTGLIGEEDGYLQAYFHHHTDYKETRFLVKIPIEKAVQEIPTSALMAELARRIDHNEARLEMERFQKELKEGIEKLRAKHAQSNPN